MPGALDGVPEKILELAHKKLRIIQPLSMQKSVSGGQVRSAAASLDTSERTIRRMIKAFSNAPYVTTFLPHRYRSYRTGLMLRLPALTDEITEKAIAKYYTGRKEAFSIVKLHTVICRACRLADTIEPSPSSIRRRIKKLPLKLLADAKKSKKHPDDLTLKPGRLVSETPLEFVQIDHTLVDQFLDLSEYGLGIRRVWLTLIIDLATRGIYSYFISIDCPNGQSNAAAMLVGCTPKNILLERLGVSLAPFIAKGIQSPWFLHGMVGTVGCDNGGDFVGGIFPQGCQYLGIKLLPRPLGAKHVGGHIERLIGSFMADVHMLPGTSFSDIRAKEGYDSQKHACMSFQEFEQWLILNILRYHLKPHAGLGYGCSPFQKFQELKGNIPVQWHDVDIAEVRRAFLKRVPRTITNKGIRHNNRFYAGDSLKPYVGQKVMVGYSPADLSRLYVSFDYHLDQVEIDLKPSERSCPHEALWHSQQCMLKRHYQNKHITELTEDLLQAQLDIAVQCKNRRRTVRRKINPASPREPLALSGSITPLKARMLDVAR